MAVGVKDPPLWDAEGMPHPLADADPLLRLSPPELAPIILFPWFRDVDGAPHVDRELGVLIPPQRFESKPPEDVALVPHDIAALRLAVMAPGL